MIDAKALKKHPELEELFAQLLARLHCHIEANTTDLGDKSFTIPVEDYYCPDRFQREWQMMKQKPIALGAASLVAEPGNFFVKDIYGTSLLVVRDHERIRVFANVCRHRGASVAEQPSGCARHFKCPFHGWTYDLQGNLIHMPGEQTAIPEHDKKNFALREYPCLIKAGIVWGILGSDASPEQQFGEIGRELDKLLGNDYREFRKFVHHGDFNWKICVESFLEIYHFRATHGNTLPKLKYHNISLVDTFADHSRTVVPINSIGQQFADVPREQWQLFGHVNIMYFIFPSNFLLVFSDHFGWINIVPLAIDKTQITYATLVPQGDLSEDDEKRFAMNAQGLEIITKEDFAVSETIQQRLQSGAQSHFSYTRFEQLIEHFHERIAQNLV